MCASDISLSLIPRGPGCLRPSAKGSNELEMEFQYSESIYIVEPQRQANSMSPNTLVAGNGSAAATLSSIDALTNAALPGALTVMFSPDVAGGGSDDEGAAGRQVGSD